MTGFGRSQFEDKLSQITVEVKALNSRFLDIYFRLPRHLNALEVELGREIKKRVDRGKIEVTLTVMDSQESNGLSLNVPTVKAYQKIVQSLHDELGASAPKAPLSTFEWLQLEGVVKGSSATGDLDLPAYKKVLHQALDQLIETREKEGAHLETALKEQLSEIHEALTLIDEKSEDIRLGLKDKLFQKLDILTQELQQKAPALSGTLETDVFATELSLQLDRLDIAEEVTRLGGHTKAFQELFTATKPIGRQMDFLCQEMHREINTISSKISHLEIASLSVKVKQAVERLRQQVQNIE